MHEGAKTPAAERSAGAKQISRLAILVRAISKMKQKNACRSSLRLPKEFGCRSAKKLAEPPRWREIFDLGDQVESGIGALCPRN
jgi:hypothetical protein